MPRPRRSNSSKSGPPLDDRRGLGLQRFVDEVQQPLDIRPRLDLPPVEPVAAGVEHGVGAGCVAPLHAGGVHGLDAALLDGVLELQLRALEAGRRPIAAENRRGFPVPVDDDEVCGMFHAHRGWDVR